MALLESIERTAWTTCERCGNTYSAGDQQCSRCGNTPTIMQRLANFSYLPNGKRGSTRGVLRRTRSRGAYPGLAETALLSDRASKRRATRIALACAVGAGVLLTYALAQPYLADMEFSLCELMRHPCRQQGRQQGQTVQSGPVVSASGDSVSQAQSSLSSGRQITNDKNGRTPQSNVSAFDHVLQGGNLAAARRYLAGISASDVDSGQLAQMRTELVDREHTRDALLHHAWHCRAVGDWQCVADNAAQALTIDASSWEGKHLKLPAQRRKSAKLPMNRKRPVSVYRTPRMMSAKASLTSPIKAGHPVWRGRNKYMLLGYQGDPVPVRCQRQSVPVCGNISQHATPNAPATWATAVSTQMTRSSCAMMAAVSPEIPRISRPRQRAVLQGLQAFVGLLFVVPRLKADEADPIDGPPWRQLGKVAQRPLRVIVVARVALPDEPYAQAVAG